jgi:hypothetical protein
MTTDRRAFLRLFALALPTLPRALAQAPAKSEIPVSAPYEGWMKMKVGKRSHEFIVQVGANTPPRNLIAAILETTGPDDLKSNKFTPPETFTATELPALKPGRPRMFQVTMTNNGQSFDGTATLTRENLIDTLQGTLTTQTGVAHIKAYLGGREIMDANYDPAGLSNYDKKRPDLKLSDIPKILHPQPPNP